MWKVLKGCPKSWLLISAVIGVACYAFPTVDLWVSGLFFKEGDFYLAKHPLLVGIHNSVKFGVMGLVVIYTLLFISNLYYKRPVLWGLTERHLLYLFLALAMGPGLVVNSVFKEHWGRARPMQVAEFSGDKQFTPAFVITNQCETNCSFVSGDPSVGFYLFSVTLLFGIRLLWLPLVMGGILGSVRIIQGAHFFSDVLLSGIFTFWVCYFLYVILVKKYQQKQG